MTLLFEKIEDVRTLAQIIVETVREPLLVLDHDLKILVASASFHRAFRSIRRTPGKLLFALDAGGWDIPRGIRCWSDRWRTRTEVEGFLVAQEFPRSRARIFLLHARKVLDTKIGHSLILLGFEDITERRAIEQEKELLKKQTIGLPVRRVAVGLAVMQFRIVNSLQIMAVAYRC